MKKTISIFLALIFVLSALFAVQAASVGKVSSVSVVKTTKNSVELKWKKVSKATGYQIYYKTKKDKNFKIRKIVKKGSTVSVGVYNLRSDKTYYFKVRAVKKSSKGKFSKVVKVKTKKNACIDRKMVGTWTNVLSMVSEGDPVYDFKFYGNGRVKVIYRGEDAVRSMIVNCICSKNTASFFADGNKYSVTYIKDSSLMKHRYVEGTGFVNRSMVIRTKDNDWSDSAYNSFMSYLNNTCWDSKYFKNYVESRGYSFNGVSFSSPNDGSQILTSCVDSKLGHSSKTYFSGKNIYLAFFNLNKKNDKSASTQRVVLEKKSSKKMNAFIFDFGKSEVGYTRETWTKR